MKIFYCTHCQHQIFFENWRCLHCGEVLAFLPELQRMAAIRADADGLLRPVGFAHRVHRLCANYARNNLCNWAVADSDPDPLCVSCRLTRHAPASAAQRPALAKLEASKRRLVYALLLLSLPVEPKSDQEPRGVCFDFLSDTDADGHQQRITTGHDNGVITINLAEADDVYREVERTRHGEPYRTLLGHFRHEIGHYYWDRLLRGSRIISNFRAVFGDERSNYGRALARHYAKGPPPDWQQRYISAYASAHPWEDWAECWAHVLHMIDTLESATGAGLALLPVGKHLPRLRPMTAASVLDMRFDDMIERWVTVTYLMNKLNRGLGLADSYPFVLTPPIREKLRFIYRLLQSWLRSGRVTAPGGAGLWIATAGIAALTMALGASADQLHSASD